MSYKYDKENGYRNADQLNADLEEFNPDVVDVVIPIKKLPSIDVRNAINIIGCREKRQEIDKQEQIIKEKIIVNNKNLVADIEADMKAEEKNENEDEERGA